MSVFRKNVGICIKMKIMIGGDSEKLLSRRERQERDLQAQQTILTGVCIMNNARRKEIQRAVDIIKSSIDLLENILSDEEDAFSNMSEGLQTSENGIASEEAQDNLNEAIVILEEAVECLEEI